MEAPGKERTTLTGHELTSILAFRCPTLRQRETVKASTDTYSCAVYDLSSEVRPKR
jgi:hypothetical protein